MLRNLEPVFYFLAVVLLGVTAYFYWTDGGGDRVFAAFIVMCAAAFLGYRFRLKGRLDERPRQKPDENEE